MTFSDMQNQVMLFLGVSSVTNSGVTLQEIKDCINRALPEVGANIEDLLTYCEYDCVASTQKYSISQHFITAKQLILRTDSGGNTWERLTLLNLEEWEKTTYGASAELGQPEYYKIERWATAISNDPQIPGDIYLWPIPDDTYKFRFYYYQRPTTLTNDTDITELPAHWQMLPCYKAAEWLAIKKKDFVLANELVRRYNEGLFLAKRQSMRPQRDRSFRMQDEMGYSDLE